MVDVVTLKAYNDPVVRKTDAEEAIEFMLAHNFTIGLNRHVHKDRTLFEYWLHPSGDCFNRTGPTLAEATKAAKLGLQAYRLEHPEVADAEK